MEKAKKITHYYLCQPVGRIKNEVGEHDEEKWITIKEAIKLTAEFKIWEKEEEILKKL